MPKYKAIINTRHGEQITIDLNCREYHANKLNYVFSRTLDRSIYSGCEIVACDAVQADARPAHSREPRQILSHEKKLIGGK